MTMRKHFKRLVRDRMARTGESYAAARRRVIGQAEPTPAPAGPLHYPGNVPATTALRTILANAGVRAPHTGRPFTEPMLFGIAGGVGIGVFSFFYEKAGAASFFIAGRHLWHDDLAYLTNALDRLGIAPSVRESGGAKAADSALRAALEAGPCVAWVDMAHLPHRGLPAQMSGSGYHVVTVYRVEADGTAWIGDLADGPIAVPGPALAEARGRIKKDKYRVLSIPPSAGPGGLAPLVLAGLRACHGGLLGEGGVASARSNFSLEALRRWAGRLHGDPGKEGWDRVFTPGARLWRGLSSIAQYVERRGGGLARPLFAEFLTEAGEALGDARLRPLADRYAELGRGWCELADAALPRDVPEFREARELHARIDEATNGGDDPAEILALWQRLHALESRADDGFPLSDADCASLRAGLQRRVHALHAGELAAHEELGRLLA